MEVSVFSLRRVDPWHVPVLVVNAARRRVEREERRERFIFYQYIRLVAIIYISAFKCSTRGTDDASVFKITEKRSGLNYDRERGEMERGRVI